MLTRIITSLVAIAIFTAVVVFDPFVLQCAVILVVLAMLYETAQPVTKSKAVKLASYIGGMLVLVGSMANGSETPFIAAVIFLFTALTVAMHGKVSHREVLAMGFMTLYISLFMLYIAKLRLEFGLCEMLIVFISAWGSDTGAYFAGSFFGKHKLIPHVSPKKTVEGSIGGMLSAMICCQLLLFVSGLCGAEIAGLSGAMGYITIGVIGIAASAASQIGDLAASAIKRDCGVKDYGKIFPGHGGFMDRFDSVIFIAPMIYYIIRVIL